MQCKTHVPESQDGKASSNYGTICAVGWAVAEPAPVLRPSVGCWAGANTSAVVSLEKSVGTNPWLLVQLLAQN